MRSILALLSLAICFTACEPTLKSKLEAQMVASPVDQAGKDKNQLLQYAIDNQLDVQSTESGILYVIENAGTGEAQPDQNSQITAHYHGQLTDGTVFDSSVDRGEPFQFTLGGVIRGWQEAIKLLKKGGKGKFLIPSELAYGVRGAGGAIPPNTPLVFDIELIDFVDRAEMEAKQRKIDDEAISQYLQENQMEAQRTESGIYYLIEKEGTGDAQPDQNAQITAHYHGTLLNGTVFDSSVDRGEPFSFSLGGVIPGWQEAMKLLKKGGKGKFLIPSGLAYGSRGSGPKIPPNSPLIFDIELIDFADRAQLQAQQAKTDENAIKSYVRKQGMKTKQTKSGIHYVMEKEGEGDAHPTVNSQVTVHYRGTLLDGTVFDSSYDRGEPISFKLSQVIPGWQEAIPLLKKGGKATFVIPSGMAYGARKAGKIPPNSVLAFEVELIDF